MMDEKESKQPQRRSVEETHPASWVVYTTTLREMQGLHGQTPKAEVTQIDVSKCHPAALMEKYQNALASARLEEEIEKDTVVAEQALIEAAGGSKTVEAKKAEVSAEMKKGKYLTLVGGLTLVIGGVGLYYGRKHLTLPGNTPQQKKLIAAGVLSTTVVSSFLFSYFTPAVDKLPAQKPASRSISSASSNAPSAAAVSRSASAAVPSPADYERTTSLDSNSSISDIPPRPLRPLGPVRSAGMTISQSFSSLHSYFKGRGGMSVAEQARQRKLTLKEWCDANNVHNPLDPTYNLAASVSDIHNPLEPLVFVSESFCKLTGYARHEVLGRNCRFLQGPLTDPADIVKIRLLIDERRTGFTHLLNYTKTGETFHNVLYLMPLLVKGDAEGAPVRFYLGCQLSSEDDLKPPYAQILENNKRLNSTVNLGEMVEGIEMGRLISGGRNSFFS